MARWLWTQKQNIGPSPRIRHLMTYDLSRKKVVLFGGDSFAGDEVPTKKYNDTWEWDGEGWTQVADTGPPARVYSAMAYDISRQKIILFGGVIDNTPIVPVERTYFGDTWEWDGSEWTQVADTGPSVRYAHAMAYDTEKQKIILFGGRHEIDYGDTWEWDGSEWTQIQDVGPSPRGFHLLAYDTSTQELILIGGSGVDDLGSTWRMKADKWKKVQDIGPGSVVYSAMVDSLNGIVLFGGTIGGGSINNKTWQWEGKFWKQRQDVGPSPRSGHSLAYDSIRDRVVLFGGTPDSPQDPKVMYGDTWELKIESD